MFELGKVFIFVFHPARIAFVLLCAGILLLFSRRWRMGRALLAGLLVLSATLGTVPAGDWLLNKLEYRFPRPAELPPRVDGIILLGGEINAVRTLATGLPVMGRAARLLAFAELSRRFPDARLVFSGGSGRLFDQTAEAAAMPIAMRAIGLDPARVIFEGKSRNTHENATFTREIVDPKPGETWVLVTTASHMPRAVGAFRQAGLPVLPYPVEFRTTQPLSWDLGLTFDGGFHDLAAPMKEWVGLAAYRLLGYSDALFPAP
jgi:uncharacterized SAM-binding protein YcdF (DUF218 family)